MQVGVPKEVKRGERRFALTPAAAGGLTRAGHTVLVERGAGLGARFPDELYAAAGATIADCAADVWSTSDLVVKVKEPIAEEHEFFREDLTLFTYLHLAPNPDLVEALVGTGMTAIAYETVETHDRRLPLLTPMSEIAGRLAAQAGAYFLQQPLGGPGILMGGAPGVEGARVLIVGGGVVGTEAARVAVGMGADVTVLERSIDRLRCLEELFGTSARLLMSDGDTLAVELARADLVIGAVLVPAEVAPRLVDREMLKSMAPGSVVVDVAIDQGGCFETARATTHDQPTYVADSIVHYCVANMPGAVPVTATRALTNATLPYVLRLADLGVEEAVRADPALARGVNVRGGDIVTPAIRDAYAAAARVMV